MTCLLASRQIFCYALDLVKMLEQSSEQTHHYFWLFIHEPLK
jgi:hypothetical protein